MKITSGSRICIYIYILYIQGRVERGVGGVGGITRPPLPHFFEICRYFDKVCR